MARSGPLLTEAQWKKIAPLLLKQMVITRQYSCLVSRLHWSYPRLLEWFLWYTLAKSTAKLPGSRGTALGRLRPPRNCLAETAFYCSPPWNAIVASSLTKSLRRTDADPVPLMAYGGQSQLDWNSDAHASNLLHPHFSR